MHNRGTEHENLDISNDAKRKKKKEKKKKEKNVGVSHFT